MLFPAHAEGIFAADVERVKRPFTRLDTARSNVVGAGLGLAIVEGVPATVKEAVSKADSETMKKKLEEAGAKVEIK